MSLVPPAVMKMMGSLGSAPGSSHGLEAGPFGQHDIQEHHVGPPLQQIEPLVDRAGGQHADPRPLHGPLNHKRNGAIVVDNQNTRHVVLSLGLAAAVGLSAASTQVTGEKASSSSTPNAAELRHGD